MALSRRSFLRCAGSVAAAGVVAACSTTGTRGAQRPNILFVYTDDHAPWALGASGNAQAHTPNMDRLVADGAYLTNSFVTTPVCSPSRVGSLCSRYGTEMGITDWINPNEEPELGLDAATPCWVRDLESAGYATALVGKWHLGIQDRHHPSHFGYQSFSGFRPGGNKVENPELEVDGEPKTHEGLTTDILTDFALEYLDRFAGQQPFLLSVHYRAPHAPWLPVADEDWAPFADMDPKLPPHNEPDLDVERAKRLMREYLASVAGVDRNLGRLLDALDRLGLAENTIVVFTSDNGYNIGHHGLLHKGNASRLTNEFRGKGSREPGVTRPNLFDTSLRVPTIIRWPGRIHAGRLAQSHCNLDWYPTLLAMTGVDGTPNLNVRGRNFWPVLRGDDVEWNNDLYGEYSIHHYTQSDLRMYRTPEWKLVRDFRNQGRDELYHLAQDPGETQNRIDDPTASDTKARLNELLEERMRTLNDPVLNRTSNA